MTQHIAKVRQRIEQAARACGRDPKGITLIAVSKTHPSGLVEKASRCGIHDFGENYLQEALAKINCFQTASLIWHFVGPVQSNKARKVAQHFAWVHTVHNLGLARRLNSLRDPALPRLNVCVQVNINREITKAGIMPEALVPFLRELQTFDNLAVRGLMVLPKYTGIVTEQHLIYQQVHRLFQQVQAQGLRLDTLSMGTSHDLEVAIAYGATHVRIGQAIFGPRIKRESV